MQTSFRLVAAGVLASTAAAAEAAAQSDIHGHPAPDHICHAGYDCLEYKVTDTLDTLIDEADDARKECLDTAYDLREELIDEIKVLRTELQQDSKDRADASISALADVVEASLASLDATLAQLKDDLKDEKIATAKRVRSAAWDTIDQVKAISGDYDEQAGYGYGSPQYGRGSRATSRRLYAQVEDHQSPHFLDSERDDGINEIVTGFEATLEAEAAAIAALISAAGEEMKAAGEAEKAAFATASDAARDAYNVAAAADHAELEEYDTDHFTNIQTHLGTLDALIAAKLAEMDAEIERLRAEYIEEFLTTLWAIHEQAQSYQRVLLTAKAESKRADFFDSLGDIRVLLARGLANTRGNFVNQRNDEWARLQGTQDYARSKLANESAALAQTLWDGADADSQDLAAFSGDVADWLDERLLQVGHEIEQYLSGFDGYTNHYPFVVRGYTAPETQIYGYAGHDGHTIQYLADRTAVFNDDIMERFNEVTDNEIAQRQAAKDMIASVAANSNTAAIDELCLVTENLIDHIETANDAAMTALTEFYDVSVEGQEDTRAAIEESIETLKADIFAELEALKEELNNGGRASGWYGSSMELWAKIKELTQVYHDAADAAREDFAGMQGDSAAAWADESAAADAAYAAVLAQKELDWQAASDVAAAAWAAARATALADWTAARDASLAKIEEFIVEKENDLLVRYNALTNSINNIYDFHLQHKAQAALDAARDEAAAECRARYAELEAAGDEIQQCFVDADAEQDARHSAAQEDKEGQCDAAVEEQDGLWGDYFADITADFVEFQGDEDSAFNAALEAWASAFHKGIKEIKRYHFGYGRYGRGW